MSWSAKKEGRSYFCVFSGGYVMTGSRPSENHTDMPENIRNTHVDDFLKDSEAQDRIRKNMGDAILKEVVAAVNKAVAYRTRRTPAPSDGPSS